MRWNLFLTESEADDLKRQDFMKGADLVRIQDTKTDDLCKKGVLSQPKYKKEFSPPQCGSVKHLWVQTDASSCGACAINNATQTLIAEDLCTHWLGAKEIVGMLKNANLQVREWGRDRLKEAQERGDLRDVVGIVVNLENSHWVALRPCTGGGWYVLNSYGKSFSKFFATLDETLDDVPTFYKQPIQWPMIVISEGELPTKKPEKTMFKDKADVDISDDD